MGVLTEHLGALEAEYDALRDEFRAVTDDLEAMVKENQESQGAGPSMLVMPRVSMSLSSLLPSRVQVKLAKDPTDWTMPSFVFCAYTMETEASSAALH